MDPILGALLVALLVMWLATIAHARHAWNGGICEQTGTPWRVFDRDSGGGYGITATGRDGRVVFRWVSRVPLG